MLSARAPQREVTAETPAAHSDARRIHVRPGHRDVQDGRQHVLPVGAQRQILLKQGPALPGPVEDQAVPAAGQHGNRLGGVGLVEGGIVAAGHHDQWPWPVPGAMEPARQRRPLERDLQRLAGAVEQRVGLGERIRLPGEAGAQPRVDGRAVQRVVADREVPARAEIGVPGGGAAVAGGHRSVGHRDEPLGGRRPRVVPGVVVAIRDAGAGGDHLTRRAAQTEAEIEGEIVEQRVGGQHAPEVPSRHGSRGPTDASGRPRFSPAQRSGRYRAMALALHHRTTARRPRVGRCPRGRVRVESVTTGRGVRRPVVAMDPHGTVASRPRRPPCRRPEQRSIRCPPAPPCPPVAGRSSFRIFSR